MYTLALNREDKINEWRLSVDIFSTTLPGLFDKLNRSARPVFKATEIYIFSKRVSKLNEMKMIGTLWKIQLLPSENLFIRDD